MLLFSPTKLEMGRMLFYIVRVIPSAIFVILSVYVMIYTVYKNVTFFISVTAPSNVDRF